MSWSSVRSGLDIASVAVDVAERIEGWAHVGGDKAEAALAAIRSALAALKEGIAGKTSPEVVLAQLEALHVSLRDNDAAADSALDAKFKAAP